MTLPAEAADERFASGEIAGMVTAVLTAAGASEENARIVAEHLVEAELCGRDSHGVRLVGLYVDRLLGGQLEGKAKPSVLRDSGAIVNVSGNKAFGQIVGDFATAIGVQRAKEFGCCLVSVQESGHLGRNARWPEYAADHGVASIHFGHAFGSSATVVPFGAVEPKLRTSPIAIGAPSADGRHVILDFSVSEISANAVRMAAERGERLATACLVGPDGVATDDPAAYVAGAAGLMAFGGFKGYGMAVFAELFAGIIGGGGRTAAGNNNMLSIYFDVKQVTDWERYSADLTRFCDDLRSARPKPGMPAISVPGDRTRRTLARSGETIRLDAPTRHALGRAAEKAGTLSDLARQWPSVFAHPGLG